ncbi:hypothetical protein HQ545_01505 [Candidatus Woesearchaeota archaeon]|nr:hypothetical protein [Candidatus Woesearchaeota archaeon]
MKIGIIGGSGPDYFGKAVGRYQKEHVSELTGKRLHYETGRIADTIVVSLPRHGPEHSYDPAHVDDLSNMLVMHKEKVDLIIGISATGILDHKRINVGDVVFPDQIFRYNVRQPSFFGDKSVVHTPYRNPVCETYLKKVKGRVPDLHRMLEKQGLESRVHAGGTFVAADGPGFSTDVESRFFRKHVDNAAVIGMTMKEAYAAKGIACYINIAHATDADNPPEGYKEEAVDQDKVSEQAEKNKATIEEIVLHLVKVLPKVMDCGCKHHDPKSVLSVSNKTREIELRLLRDGDAITSQQYHELMDEKGFLGKVMPSFALRAKTAYHDHLKWRMGL